MDSKFFLEESRLADAVADLAARLWPETLVTREPFASPIQLRGVHTAIVVRCTVDDRVLADLRAVADTSPAVRLILVTCLNSVSVRSLSLARGSLAYVLWEDELIRLSQVVLDVSRRGGVQHFLSQAASHERIAEMTRAALAEIANGTPPPRTVEGLAMRLGCSSKTIRRQWAMDVSGEVPLKRVLDLRLFEQWWEISPRLGSRAAARALGVDVRTIQRIAHRLFGASPSTLRANPQEVAETVARLLPPSRTA